MLLFFLLKKYFIYLFIFRERGREGEREGEKHQWMVASQASPTGDLTHNPGVCPDWESNRRPFGSKACAQSTEPHQPGLLQCLDEKAESWRGPVPWRKVTLPVSGDPGPHPGLQDLTTHDQLWKAGTSHRRDLAPQATLRCHRKCTVAVI